MMIFMRSGEENLTIILVIVPAATQLLEPNLYSVSRAAIKTHHKFGNFKQ
jgi:hypothetical protein